MSTFQYSFFESVKDGTIPEGGLWGCNNPLECKVQSHQTIGTDPRNFIGLTGTVVGYLNLGFTGTQTIPFIWNFSACYGSDAQSRSMLWVVGSVTQPENLNACPNVTPYTHRGVTRVTDGNFTLKFDDGYDRNDFNFLRVFVGDMNIQLTLPSSSSSATISATTAPSSTSSSTNLTSLSIASPQSGTATGSFASVPAPDNPWTNSQTETAVIGPSASQIAEETVGRNNSSKIAAISAGIAGGLLILLLIGLFLLRRRRQKRREQKLEQEGSEEVTPWTPRGEYPPPQWRSARVEKSDALILGDSSPSFQLSKPPLISQSSHSGSNTGSSSMDGANHIGLSPSHVRPAPHANPASPNPTVTTALPPSYDMHPYHQIVTPRQIEEDEYSSIDDMSLVDDLRQWAETHRDIVPTDLERRLRAGGFDPSSNPREIPREMWERRFRVTPYELRGLQELYDMRPAT